MYLEPKDIERRTKLLNYLKDKQMDEDQKLMLVLFDEISYLFMRDWEECIGFDHPKTWNPPDSIKYVVNEIIAPENRKALRKWYNISESTMNSSAIQFKRYIEFVTKEWL